MGESKMANPQPFLQAAQLEIRARDLADDRDLRCREVGGTGRGVGTARFDAAWRRRMQGGS